MRKLLSVCIASYNKSEITNSLVKNILTCSNPEIEVVVVDNASSDDTVEQLGKIKDDRLRVISNEENIGGSRNLVNLCMQPKATSVSIVTTETLSIKKN